MSNKLKIIALCTCHNRADKTYLAIKSLVEASVHINVDLNIYVVLDNCKDNTNSVLDDIQQSESVKITPIPHIGEDLFWAGGMRFGYQKILKNGDQFDYLFVFNDDVIFNNDALINLLNYLPKERSSSVLVGPFHDEANRASYGGKRKTSRLLPLRLRVVDIEAKPVFCDTLNMNGALIPAEMLSDIGFLSDKYKHTLADYDFGHKVISGGGKIISIPHRLGFASLNQMGRPKQSRVQQIKSFNNSIINGSIRERFYYYTRWGGFRGFLYFLLPYLKIMMMGYRR